MRLRGLVVACLVLVAGCGGGDTRVVVAAGTTLVDSGVLDRLAGAYETTHPGVEISIVPRPTAEVLALGERGAADVLVTHAPSQEEAFLAAHPGAVAQRLFTSRFELLAPLPAASRLDGRSVSDAFGALAAEGHPFVTRMDGSGTYDAERRIWAAVPLEPEGAAWYESTGSGMGFSLQVADQRQAAILAEAGSFLRAGPVVDLVVVRTIPEDDPLLANPYTAIVVAGAPASASDFVAWMVSPPGRTALARANDALFGTQVFSP